MLLPGRRCRASADAADALAVAICHAHHAAIRRLSGRAAERDRAWLKGRSHRPVWRRLRCIVDVGGVGYLVFCSPRTLRRCRGSGEAASLRIETHVREDPIRLFGFTDRGRARLVPPADHRPGRRHPRRAGDPLGARRRRARHAPSRSATRRRSARADGVGPKLASASSTELKDKAPACQRRRRRRPSCRRDLGGARRRRRRCRLRAGQSRLWPGPGLRRRRPRRCSEAGDGRRPTG